MPELVENKLSLVALDLTLEQISLLFIYEQGDDVLPISQSLDYFILMQSSSKSIDDIAKSKPSQNTSPYY